MSLEDQVERTDRTDDHIFTVSNLSKHFEARSGEGPLKRIFGEENKLKAVDDVSFEIFEGEILGLAGQSGCGKSTLGELLIGLQQATAGEINFDGEDITEYGKSQMNRFRRRCQVIFQDPYEAMNPRFPVARTVSEPLTIHGIGDREERDARTIEALEDAGLTPPEQYLDNLPGELSGGERQRVCIARALVLDPDFLVADEPVSMLDVSVRTGILHLFKQLQEERNMSMLYISHDLSTINYLTDRTMVMYMGDIVEKGGTEQVIHEPAHPYTEALLEAVPNPDPNQARRGSQIGEDVPDPVDLPQGCRFHPRCQYATEECRETEPPLEPVDKEASSQKIVREAACYHPVNK